MRNLPVHRINFFDLPAKSIHCLSYNERTMRLAIARSDFSVEIWDLREKPFVEKIFVEETSNSVEAVAWCDKQLFSVGLHGCIIEYDFASSIAKPAASIGNGIWCVEVNESISLMAIGTEDGHVCIYMVRKNGLEFKRSFDKQEGRILCLAWHQSGDFIVTGSIDVIRVWNVNQGSVSERIIVGRKENCAETIIWCIKLTNNMTIISGDSTGRTSFWDGITGTLLNSATTHKADVLAMCVSKDEKTVYTAGVDPVIVTHERMDGSCRNKWIKSVQRSLHSHDVRALVSTGNYLISGGVDSNLIFSRYPPKTVVEYSPFSRVSYSEVAEEKNYILFQYPNCLEVWKFKTVSGNGNIMDSKCPHLPVKLLSLKSKSEKTIVCSTISRDGKWVSYSTISRMKLFFMNEDEEFEKVTLCVKQVCLPEKVGPATLLKFISANKLAIVLNGRLLILDCNVDGQNVVIVIDNCFNEDFIDTILLNCCSKYIAISSSNGSVLVFDVEKLKVHSQLPPYKCQPTALSFDTSYDHLVLIYSDRKVMSYNLQRKVCNEFCSAEFMAKLQSYSNYSILGMLFPKHDESVVILYDEANIYIMDYISVLEPDMKQVKHELPDKQKHKFCAINSYKHILDVHQLSDGSIVVIEIKPSRVQYNLSSPLWKKHYGT